MHTTHVDTIIGIYIDFFSLRYIQRYSEILLTRRTIVLLIIFRRPLISEYYFLQYRPDGYDLERKNEYIPSMITMIIVRRVSVYRAYTRVPSPVTSGITRVHGHYCYSPSDYVRIFIICTLNYILIFDLCPRAYYNDATATIWSRVHTPTHRHEIIRNCWNKKDDFLLREETVQFNVTQ